MAQLTVRNVDSDLVRALRRIKRDHAERTLPVDATVADRWGRLGIPDPISPVDGLLSATALVHGLVLVTRNASDLARTGVQTLNPFSR
jgi:predicted nucleic acid-binding protein